MKEDAAPVPVMGEKMFGSEDILKIAQLFKEADADGGGGLDVEEFEVLLKMMYPSVEKDGIKALHMKIDTNCDGSVDLTELLTYLLDKDKALEKMKNEVFPKPIEVTSLNYHKTIKGVVFVPDRDPDTSSEDSKVEIRRYKKGNYVTVSANGVVNIWTQNFHRLKQVFLCKGKEELPFSHVQKMYIDCVAYITDLRQLAVSTEKEIRFYDCNDDRLLQVSHTLLMEENSASVMNYWSNGTKAIFSFGDVKGCLYVFVSNNVPKYQLFNRNLFEKDDSNVHPTVYVSSLLSNTVNNYMCFKVPLFSGICSQTRYFPDIDTIAVCGNSSKNMVLVAMPGSAHHRVIPRVFDSPRRKAFFSCVEYCPLEKILLTGGTDGVLRVWNPQENRFSKRELLGHVKPIKNMFFNPMDKILISISEDKNVRVWSKNSWMCQQSFIVEELGHYPISSLYYSAFNNELILANLDIGKLAGRGTDVFTEFLKSHLKPLCCVLHHQIFNQVVSVCQDGIVKVWSTLTGKAVMRFKIVPDKCEGHTIMTFDEPQRRLITVTPDRKVKLWNFNNGVELAVLPFDVPKGMTSVVCRKNRVFIAGRNRKIFDIDIGGEYNSFMQHDYLTDVSSMDILANHLFTTSSNGNTIIWDTVTSQAVLLFNCSINLPPLKRIKTHRPRLPDESCQKNSRLDPTTTTPGAVAKNETVVSRGPIILCLKTRVVDFKTATVLISADSYIYAWPTIAQGVMFAKFKAVKDDGVVITAMSTDVHNQRLLTEDSTGNVYLWDIQNFGFKKQPLEEPFEIIDGCPVSLCPPPLLGYWKSPPTAGRASVVFDCAGNVITAGLDCNVRLWTKSGRHQGIFGKDEWEMDPSTGKDADQEQADCLVTAETRSPVQFSQSQTPFTNIQQSFPESPKETSSPPPDPANCFKNRKLTSPPPHQPELTDNQLYGQYNSLEKAEEKTGRTHVSKHTVKKGSKKTSKPSEPVHLPPVPDKVRLTDHQKPLKPTLPPISRTTQRNTKNTSLHRQKGAATQRSKQTADPVCFPSILNTGQLTNSLIMPHPPQTPRIQGGTDLRGSSLQTATPRFTFGSLIKYQPRDASRESDLRPCHPNLVQVMQGSEQKHVVLPPILHGTHSNTLNTSPHMQNSLGGRSEHIANHVRFPPISDIGQLTNSLFRPHPPQTPPIRGDTGLRGSSLQTATPGLNETKPTFGRVLEYQPGDASRDSDLRPHPPATDRASEMQRHSSHVDPPLDSDSVDLTHHQPQLKPHVPLIWRASGWTYLPRFSRVKEFI